MVLSPPADDAVISWRVSPRKTPAAAHSGIIKHCFAQPWRRGRPAFALPPWLSPSANQFHSNIIGQSVTLAAEEVRKTPYFRQDDRTFFPWPTGVAGPGGPARHPGHRCARPSGETPQAAGDGFFF